MARQVYRFAVSTPAGTPKVNPQLAQLPVPPGTVAEVRLRVPPGPAGNLGLQLAIAGQQVIPYALGQWIVADNESLPYPLENYPESGAWELFSYNTGAYPHTVQIEFLMAPISAPAAQPVTLLPFPLLSGGPFT